MIHVNGSTLAVGEKLEKRLEVTIVDDYDVVVVGGGVAGLAAAVAAGRLGAKVLLVERKSFVGGNAAMGLVILGFHTITGKRASAGVVEEFMHRLKALGGCTDAIRDARICSFSVVEPVWVKILGLEMLREAGVKVLLHSGITDVICEGEAVGGVVINGTRGIRCKVVVDTSGDGVIAAMAGAPFEIGDQNDGWTQPMSLVMRMGNVDVHRGRQALLEVGHQIYHEKFVESLGLPDPKAVFAPWASEYFNANAFRKEVHAALRVGDLPPDFSMDSVIWWKLLVPNEAIVLMARALGLDGSQPEQLSEAEQRALGHVPRLVSFLRKYVPGFEQAHLIDTAPQIGIRETRRIFGDYLLTEHDILDGRRFEDTIGLGAYYLDVHPPKGGDKTVDSMQYPLAPFEMPYRMLLPREVENVVLAGRCSSATARAFGAVRVIPACMVQGQAAGTAAAISADRDVSPRDVPIPELQASLRVQRVFLHPEESDTKLSW